MKITINIEANPKEVREFFGLPDVAPLQEEMIKASKENLEKGLAGFDATSVLKAAFPTQMQTMEVMKNAFVDAIEKAQSLEPVSEPEKKPERKR